MITFISGLMKGGKSAKLMDLMNEIPNEYMLAIKPSVDTRNGSFITSRAKTWKQPAVMVDEQDEQMVGLILRGIEKYRYVFIDEVQFFSPSFIESVMDYCTTYDVELVMAGLTYDVFGNTFPTAEMIMEYSDEDLFIKGKCDLCDCVADRDIRMVDGDVDVSGVVLVVEGSSDEVVYLTVCDGCYQRL